jgi:hypothetical protein
MELGFFSAEDRRRQGLMWLRRAAAAGNLAALHELSDSYRDGRIGLPVDTELADCFGPAQWDKTRAAPCRALEIAKHDIREP